MSTRHRYTASEDLLERLESAKHLSPELKLTMQIASASRVGLTTVLGELVLVLIDQLDELKTELREKSSGK